MFTLPVMLSLAMVIVPLIQSGISLVEKLTSGKGKGEEKKKAVVDSIGITYTKAQEAGMLGKDLEGVPVEAAQALSSIMIDFTVDLLNRVGIFKHTLDEPDLALIQPEAYKAP